MTTDTWTDPETGLQVHPCTEFYGYYHVSGHVGKFGPDAPVMTPHRWWVVGRRRKALDNFLNRKGER